MATTKVVLNMLHAAARPDQLEGMARFGMTPERRLGVAVPDMRRIAKQVGKDHALALELWKTKIPEAMMVASMVDDPGKVTGKQMEEWVKDFNSWDVCDQVCMNLFEKTELAWKKAVDWSRRDEEYVKRAAFAVMACLAWHEKKAPDEKFIKFIPVVKRAATDERSMVKKSVSWALRNIGKRNSALNEVALRAAKEIQKMDARSARWIGSDAIRDLTSETVQKRFKRMSQK
jgi:3-methyladenine DNA glycosylase AlkD